MRMYCLNEQSIFSLLLLIVQHFSYLRNLPYKFLETPSLQGTVFFVNFQTLSQSEETFICLQQLIQYIVKIKAHLTLPKWVAI